MQTRYVSGSSKRKNLVSADIFDPFRRAALVVESKIKSLEQRKKRIESYQEAQRNGKRLTGFQRSALAKLGQVSTILDDIRDVHEQFCDIAKASRAQEQQEEKDDPERTWQDLAKIKEVLMIQYILQNMRHDSVREDFLTGQNGAICLTENDLECLDEFYVEISLMNAMEEDVPPFQDQLQQSAEHLLALVNGKVKEINGTTYAKLKELVVAIQSCGYFDYTVEDPATRLISQQSPKEEPELTVQEFSVVKEDNETDDYEIQEQAALPEGIFADCTSIGVAESTGPRIEESNHFSKNVFICSICQAKFSRKHHLQRHLNIHSRKPNYCTVCKSTFPRKSELTAHMRIHTGEKRFCCEKCDATFPRKDYLQRHMFVHKNKKPFSCSVCEARFSRPSSLKGHMQKHFHDENSCCCSICDTGYVQNYKHKTPMHNHVVKEKLCCAVCSMEFTEKDQLDKHMASHNNTTFSCPVCRVKFSQKSQLGEHIHLHL